MAAVERWRGATPILLLESLQLMVDGHGLAAAFPRRHPAFALWRQVIRCDE